MDTEFWIYVIIGIIYFVSRFFKKNEQPGADIPESSKPQSGPRPESRPMTFEELLREITEGKTATEQPRPEPRVPETRIPEPVIPPRPVYEDAQRSLESIDVDEEEQLPKWKAYEEPFAQNANRVSLEETLRLEDTVVEFRKFEAFEQRKEKKLLDDYIKMLRDPQSLRQAIVLSEILKRKF